MLTFKVGFGALVNDPDNVWGVRRRETLCSYYGVVHNESIVTWYELVLNVKGRGK